MLHFLTKLFATKTITPRREDLESVLADVERIKKSYETVNMECIDYEIIPSTYKKQKREKDGDIWTTTYHDMYAIMYLAKKAK